MNPRAVFKPLLVVGTLLLCLFAWFLIQDFREREAERRQALSLSCASHLKCLVIGIILHEAATATGHVPASLQELTEDERRSGVSDRDIRCPASRLPYLYRFLPDPSRLPFPPPPRWSGTRPSETFREGPILMLVEAAPAHGEYYLAVFMTQDGFRNEPAWMNQEEYQTFLAASVPVPRVPMRNWSVHVPTP